MITWILDLHVDRIRGAATPFVEAARNRNHTVHALRDSLIPKPVDLSGIELSGPTFVRGSHGFVKHVETALQPSPGGFTHPTNFQLTTYAPILQEACINHGFQIVEYGAFDRYTGPRPNLFVKPLEEMKRFSGVVVNSKQNISEAHIEKYGKWLVPASSTKMIVSKTKQILSEYRYVVVNGKAITASTYDSHEIVNCWYQDNHVTKFVNETAQIWNPAPVYVVDVAITTEGNKIVEYNQFSTSAMYACNQELILDALEEYVKTL